MLYNGKTFWYTYRLKKCIKARSFKCMLHSILFYLHISLFPQLVTVFASHRKLGCLNPSRMFWPLHCQSIGKRGECHGSPNITIINGFRTASVVQFVLSVCLIMRTIGIWFPVGTNLYKLLTEGCDTPDISVSVLNGYLSI